MKYKGVYRNLMVLVFIFTSLISFGQSVPLGIFYQAVARDNYGKELVNKDIEVKFSIIIENPVGEIVYQELHPDVTTSKYGVFTLVIGNGTPVGGIYGELSQINWGQAYHYLKVEIKFDNDFIYMGTMQFLAVPYALYAQKSLEPGPEGPKGDPGAKGDPGDPATDDQTLSFDESRLSISGGNSVPMTSLLQNLTITSSPEGNYLGISRGNSVLLATVEADGDPKNELQDLTISSDKLKITNNSLATEWDLSRYLDNTDSQALTYNSETSILGVTGNTGTVNLSELKNDADADPVNEIQDLSYNPDNYQVSLTKGGGSATIGQIIAFRAAIVLTTVNLPDNALVDIIFDQISGVNYNDGACYNTSSGAFTAPNNGIYLFSVNISLPTSSSLIIKVSGEPYETIIGPTSSNGNFRGTITLKLNKNDFVNVAVLQTNGYPIPFNFSGYFSGFRVY